MRLTMPRRMLYAMVYTNNGCHQSGGVGCKEVAGGCEDVIVREELAWLVYTRVCVVCGKRVGTNALRGCIRTDSGYVCVCVCVCAGSELHVNTVCAWGAKRSRACVGQSDAGSALGYVRGVGTEWAHRKSK